MGRHDLRRRPRVGVSQPETIAMHLTKSSLDLDITIRYSPVAPAGSAQCSPQSWPLLHSCTVHSGSLSVNHIVQCAGCQSNIYSLSCSSPIRLRMHLPLARWRPILRRSEPASHCHWLVRICMPWLWLGWSWVWVWGWGWLRLWRRLWLRLWIACG
jgi:hypothetical protein